MKKTSHEKIIRKKDEDKPPFGKETINATYRTHPIISGMFSQLSNEKGLYLYTYYNKFCTKYLLKEIMSLEDKNLRESLLNKLKKVPKL